MGTGREMRKLPKATINKEPSMSLLNVQHCVQLMRKPRHSGHGFGESYCQKGNVKTADVTNDSAHCLSSSSVDRKQMKTADVTNDSAHCLSSSSVDRKQISARWLLDHRIQVRLNFDGVNHPFITDCEKEVEKERAGHVESWIAFLKMECADELSPSVSSTSDSKIRYPDFSPSSQTMKMCASRLQNDGVGRGGKRRVSLYGDGASDWCLRQYSGQSRHNVEPYQHLDCFAHKLPKLDPDDISETRWKWLTMVDQLQLSEHFQLKAWRENHEDGQIQILVYLNSKTEVRPVT